MHEHTTTQSDDLHVFAAKYKRIAARPSAMRAVVAVEQATIIAADNLLTNDDLYRDARADYCTART